MPKGKVNFRRTDLMRAVRAVRDTGVEVGRIEIKTEGGTCSISIVPGAPEEEAPATNEWDKTIR